MLGQFEVGTWKFLDSTSTNTSQSATEVQGTPARAIVVLAGSSLTEPFNIANGDKLDLSHVLAGAPISHDLTNLGEFVRVVGHATVDPLHGQGTTLEITGAGGSSRINLQGSGKLELKDLVQHDSLLLPPNN